MLKRHDVVASLNEVEALAAKAVRGAGAGWGVADDVARAVRWMAERRFDWSAPLLRLLGDAAGLGRLGGVFEVADLFPGADPGEEWHVGACEPIWAVAILSAALHSGALTLDLAWDGALMRLRPDGGAGARTPWAGLETLGPRSIGIKAGSAMPALPYGMTTAPGRRPVSRAAWDVIESYAARTYVAASARSRTAGAGGERIDAD